jgi:uncharacterized protein YfaP (DUF2135 family)
VPGITVALLLGGAVLGVAAESTIQLDAPIGGWRHGAQGERDAEVTATYPRPLTEHQGGRHRTLIRGRIAGATPGPHLFVVNGNPVRLFTDEAGRFLKPWAFGAGSNSIEVRSPDGERKRVQFYEAHGARPPVRIRIILTWDARADLDLHVIAPDGTHTFYGDPGLPTGGGLDVDSVDGGPEIFSVLAPLRGAYLIYLNYWGYFDAAGHHFDERRRARTLITATIAVITNENTADEKRETWVVPMRKPGDLTFVRAVRF